MAKKKIEKPKREFTRHQLSRWEQAKKRNLIVLATGIFIVIGVLLTIGIGWFINEFKPLHDTVITVNGSSYDMGYFIKMLRAYGKGQSIDYMYALVGQMPVVIERNQLIKEGAAKLGISVSSQDMDRELKKRGLSGDYRDMVENELLVKKLMDEHFGPTIPGSAEQRQVMAMLLEGKDQADQIAARLDKGEDFAALAKELSMESYTRENGGDLGWHPKDILTDRLDMRIVAEYAFGSQAGTVSPPIHDDSAMKSIGYWLLKVTERREDNTEAHVYAMLLGSEEEAKDVRARLEKGEDFAALAKELSQYETSKESGGDLGWLAPGSMTTAFDDFVFKAQAELGKLSDPIKDSEVSTKDGYWLVKVLNIEPDRKVSDEDTSFLKAQAVDEWVGTLFADPETQIDHSPLTQEKLIFAVQKAMET